MRNIKVNTDEDGRTRLILDGVDLSKRCLGYSLEQEGGEGPVLRVRLSCTTAEIKLGSVQGIKIEATPAAADATPIIDYC